jgi:2-polyprenyl-3-methyl-5-hydroxy-6-metoxy-1,4-benzoquinol methylase
MKENADPVQRHFHRTATEFDSIYSGHKSVVSRTLDRLLRWDMQERMRLTFEACQPIAGKRVLDVGCGSGRFCLPLAASGAGSVVGIDFAPAMIEHARKMATEQGLADRCTFICDDVVNYRSNEQFDYVISVGVLDYVRDDRPFLAKLRQLTRGKVILTYPRANTWRAPVRKLRLALRGCPVYFYREKDVRDHLIASGFTPKTLKEVGKLYFVEAT